MLWLWVERPETTASKCLNPFVVHEPPIRLKYYLTSPTLSTLIFHLDKLFYQFPFFGIYPDFLRDEASLTFALAFVRLVFLLCFHASAFVTKKR